MEGTMEDLNAAQLYRCLKKCGMKEALASKLRGEGIDGSGFKQLTPDVLRVMGMTGSEILQVMLYQKKELVVGSDINSSESEEENIGNKADEQTMSDALSKYFSSKELSQMGDYDKDTYYNQLQRYLKAKESDATKADLVKPKFMKDAEKRTEVTANKTNSRQVASREKAAPNSDSNTRRSSSKASSSRNASSSFGNNDSDSERASTSSGRNLFKRNASASRSTSASDSLFRNRSDSEQSEDIDGADLEPGSEQVSAETIKEAAAKFEAPEPQFEDIKPDLPKFDIIQCLCSMLKESKPKERNCFLNLLSNGIVVQEERKCIIRSLTRYLYFKHVSNPKHVTSLMKEGMAKSFVTCFPKFAAADENRMPWCHFYDSQGPKGWIVNASRPILRDNPQRPRSVKRPAPPDVFELDSDQVDAMNLLDPTRQNREEILDGMSRSFKRRKAERSRGETISFFITGYIHFRNYDGEVLCEEFSRLQPEAKDMCKNFIKIQPKILNLPQKRALQLTYDDADTLKALMLLSQHLPHDIPLKSDGEVNHSWAREEDIVVVVKVGCDIEKFVEERAANASGSTQPYILCVRGQIDKKILKTFLVLDSKCVQISTVSLLKSIDWLFKSYFVFNVRYPYGWRNTFHMLQTCFYKIFEAQSGSKKDCVTPSEFELMKKLC